MDTAVKRIVNGREVLVDTQDAHLLDQPGWTASQRRNTTYVHRRARTGTEPDAPLKGEYLHRVIMNAPKGLQVDHKNGNGLDNRRSNLRVVSQTVNSANQRSRPNRNIYRLPTGRLHVKLQRDNQTIYLGTYDTIEECRAVLAPYRAEVLNGH